MSIPTVLVIISIGYGGYQVPSTQLLPSIEACIGLKDAIEHITSSAHRPTMMCISLGSEIKVER